MRVRAFVLESRLQCGVEAGTVLPTIDIIHQQFLLSYVFPMFLLKPTAPPKKEIMGSKQNQYVIIEFFYIRVVQAIQQPDDITDKSNVHMQTKKGKPALKTNHATVATNINCQ
ncbi:uncharacterized protein LOC106884040 isoform X2 [Octopus bimaculoides]|uniref:uncharacterized protein LOC106884040 isoform X2 n=1 Tax=Octopus bimaculoides TaxID=37653 RepID=UPI0022E304AA|nr:uncharacterized protein LOC106884040 isoform X2 [Octopus bimaculoides]